MTREFHLADPAVHAKMRKRCSAQVRMSSSGAQFDSPLLEPVEIR